MNFEELKSEWKWTPIRNCPGRFILKEVNQNLSPQDLFVAEIRFIEFRVEKAKDTVIAGRITDGGLISYKRDDGTYLHTLNTVEGFERKLEQLEIDL
jgi:hypothetical protein